MENSLEFPGFPKIVSLDVIFKLKFRLTNISNKNINLVSCVYLQKGVKCQMFLETTREKSGCLENWLFCSQRIIISALKLGKKCNFKSTKTHFLLFQKWQKNQF